MFDSHTTVIRTGNTTHNVNYNSVSGTLIKSTPLSKIIRFNLKSKLAEQIFDAEQPYRIRKEKKYSEGSYRQYDIDVKIEITVLQVMLMANEDLLVEYIDNE